MKQQELLNSLQENDNNEEQKLNETYNNVSNSQEKISYNSFFF